MDKNIFIELRTALFPPPGIGISVNRGDERINQIIGGISSFTNLIKGIPGNPRASVFFVDNTVSTAEGLPGNLFDLLSVENIMLLLSEQNVYGKKNKGAGDIEIWRKNLEFICEFEWFLHFEPRTLLRSAEFLRTALDSPGNIFKVLRPLNSPEHFYTGLFMISSRTLKSFVESIDLEKMVQAGISIENNLFDYMRRFHPDYVEYPKPLNVIWHDAHENRFVEF